MNFSPDETREVLKQAARDRDLPEREFAEALSLAELQALGAELGLHPDDVARAAARYRSDEVEVVRSNLVDFTFLRGLPQPLTSLGWGFLVGSMRIATGLTGESRSDEEGTLVWSASTRREDIRLILRHGRRSLVLQVCRRDKTSINGIAGLVLGLALLVISLGVGFDARGVALMAAAVAGVGVGFAAFIAACAARAHRLSQALAEELAGVVVSGQVRD